MSKKDIINKIESINESIRVHEQKIQNAGPQDRYNVGYWQREIQNMGRELENLRRELNQTADEVECPSCRRTVIPRNRTCPRCDTYIG